MLIHLHNRAIFRHWFKKPLLERHWFKPNGGGEGDGDAKGAGGDPGQ